MRYILIIIIVLTGQLIAAQSYKSYFTGNNADKETQPSGGVCMMGGSSEDDNAMKWFLSRANGGDVLVLRASGSDGYNKYMYSDLGITVNSVETIVCLNSASAQESYIQEKIKNAEAIWFAGGDQYDYISYWQHTAIDSLIRQGIKERGVVVGGTSAGMAIMGGYMYSGQKGSVTSDVALGNPYNSKVTIESGRFLENKFLEEVITDTHYDNPDRRGRQVTFLARILEDSGVRAKGIACDEYTAVCVDTSGIARVYGEYPSSNDNAYFIQSNCGLSEYTPETCKTNLPLNWNRNNKAMWVYKIKGTKLGENTFDLNVWATGQGGVWEDWYVNNGVLGMKASTQVDCSILANDEINISSNINIYPNPVKDELNIELNGQAVLGITIFDLSGKIVLNNQNNRQGQVRIDLSKLMPGAYVMQILGSSGLHTDKLIKI